MRTKTLLAAGLAGIAVLLTVLIVGLRVKDRSGSERSNDALAPEVTPLGFREKGVPSSQERAEEAAEPRDTQAEDRRAEGYRKQVPDNFLEDPTNAFNRYLRAAELMTPLDSAPRFEEVEGLLKAFVSGETDWLSDPDKVALLEAWVAANSEAIAELKAAILESEYYESPPWVSFERDISYLKKFRALGALLAGEGLLLQLKRDMTGALLDGGYLLKMAHHIRDGGFFLDGLIGAGIADLGSLSIKRLLSNTSDALICREALAQVGQFRALKPRYSDMIRRDLEVESDLIRSRGTLRELATTTKVSSVEGRKLMLELSELPEEELQRQVEKMEALVQPLIEAADRAYPEFASLECPLEAEGLMIGEFVKGFYASNRTYITRHTLSEARMTATELLAGLKLYRIERGEFPATLDELVPQYLPEMLVDPFSGEPFEYVRGEGGATLYSVGYDLKDDLAEKEARRTNAEGDIIFEIR